MVSLLRVVDALSDVSFNPEGVLSDDSSCVTRSMCVCLSLSVACSSIGKQVGVVFVVFESSRVHAYGGEILPVSIRLVALFV